MAYAVGQKLIVQVDGNAYEGEFCRENGSCLVINKVSLYPSKKYFNSSVTFYKSEIVNIKSVDNVQAITNGISKLPSDNESNLIKLSNSEYSRLKTMTHEYIYMATVDSRYVAAVKYLNTCETISVVGLGGEFGRSAKIKLLLIASWEQIYIFDIDSFKSICNELKGLLESKDILKVVHDCRALSDSLFHNHQITINHVFDTQVADFMLTKEASKEEMPKSFRSLQECLNSYLNFPNNLLGNAKSNLHRWSERPLKDDIKSKAAMYVVYLITLRNMLEAEMLKKFYLTVDLCLNVARSADSAHSAAKSITCDIPEDILRLTI